MDQVTQQNAALVEEMAAAATSLKSQAQELVQTVAVFQLGQGAVRTAARAAPVRFAPAPVRPPVAARSFAPPARPALAAKPKTLSAPRPAAPVVAQAPKANAEQEWESF